MRVVLLAVATLIAFAANPLLCRAALGAGELDAATFTLLRVAAGAVTLCLLLRLMPRQSASSGQGTWRAAAALFLYMIAFSFAYVSLATGTGTLLLFGSVQLTMLTVALRGGERFSILGWAGFGLAFAGLIWLVAPGVSAPTPGSAALMLLAGVGWGLYSLLGRAVSKPLVATAENFLRTLPMALLAFLMLLPQVTLSLNGALLALASGALASGLGYALWYALLPLMAASTAATLQLLVPPVTAMAGVLLLDESVDLRLVGASLAVLGGVFLSIKGRAADGRA
ncbi:DMT family transporter [Thiorhodococcus mannitoliphagus]|uniref:DMT family transporter n=1 Tax=Thiorhodococcus mannitoliphagus TaxID=329406 RepID=A0A6P1DX86_9GAMM|nr:DMT family transporter [Thiorhodococcus mannitoliphagus]NEX22090.1 DMT family transporter [Thiorhodococcus mannitoliphagus]